MSPQQARALVPARRTRRFRAGGAAASPPLPAPPAPSGLHRDPGRASSLIHRRALPFPAKSTEPAETAATGTTNPGLRPPGRATGVLGAWQLLPPALAQGRPLLALGLCPVGQKIGEPGVLSHFSCPHPLLVMMEAAGGGQRGAEPPRGGTGAGRGVQGCTGGVQIGGCAGCTPRHTHCTQIFAPSPSHTHTFLPLRACAPPRISAHVPPPSTHAPRCAPTRMCKPTGSTQAHGSARTLVHTRHGPALPPCPAGGLPRACSRAPRGQPSCTPQPRSGAKLGLSDPKKQSRAPRGSCCRAARHIYQHRLRKRSITSFLRERL